jgi:hypothetical protein
MLARGPVTYSFGHPLNPSRSSVLRPQNFSASGPILPLDKLPKIGYTILMLTYSPQSRHDLARHPAAGMPPSRGRGAQVLSGCPTAAPKKPSSPPADRKTPLSCTKLCVMRKIRRIQMRNRPRVEPHSISPKPSPPIHLRRQVGNMVPSSLRVFRDLIIFRENRRKCASIRSARAAPSLSCIFCHQFFCPISSFQSIISCPRSL